MVPRLVTARHRRLTAAVGVSLVALALAACAPADEQTTTAATSGADACAPGSLQLKTAGSLTIGTDKPAYSPWFVDDDPTNGKGYESAVAYAVAKKLGFEGAKVTWVTAGFNSVVTPGKKPFDFDINQFSITDERKKAVDFSSGYYDVTQAVVTNGKTPVKDATTIAALKSAKLGAQVGTTSYRAITDVIKPTQAPSVFDSNDLAKLALDNGQIDALVVDLPTALYLAAAEIDGGKVIGQLPPTGGAGAVEQFGLVLAKGSPLTPCVSKAVDALRADGTLKTLETQWLANDSVAPVLK